MAQRAIVKPWHEVVELRDDLKSGELSLSMFAADLHDVIMQKGLRPAYEDPAEFFALTYPTYNLRELVRDVCLRLAGRSDKAYRSVSVNYGGGKTHTLITLRHLVHDPDNLPDLPSIREFETHIGLRPPKARIAALCFDKIDLEKALETIGPDGISRNLRHPWSILAYQIAGNEGLSLIHAEGKDEERQTPPAEPLLLELLSKPQEQGLSTLILVDEVLMYARGRADVTGESDQSIINFFQYLTQATVKVNRCSMVASLRASDPRKYDEKGRRIYNDLTEVFGRQTEVEASPVTKDDIAEVLRRRFFKPESVRDPNAFRPQVNTVVGNIAELDEQIQKTRPSSEERFLAGYPFHPDLTDNLYTRWTQLDGFQRTRGILRTFAIALVEAEKWDNSPIIGPNVFLNEPGKTELSESASEMAGYASVDTDTGSHQEWRSLLEGELDKARSIQSEMTGLRSREMEQAVLSVFIGSQPIGQKIQTQDVMRLIASTKPDKIELETALNRWADASWFLDEAEIGSSQTRPDGTRTLPANWRLGNRPNLRQMHDDACSNRVSDARVEEALLEHIRKNRQLTNGASAAGARVHNLPDHPRDIGDDGEFHYAVLGPAAASESGKPNALSRRFINETTSQDRPRVNRNAIVLAVPSKDGLIQARNQVRQYLGWMEVRGLLNGQPMDENREKRLSDETAEAERRIPDAIRQAYSLVVAVNAENEPQAFRIAPSNEPLFSTIKADSRARIQDTEISAEAMLPGGPYDLWREGEESRRAKDLITAFAQNPKLPKMLSQRRILDTLGQGIREGIWVGRLTRPDRTVRTFWRTAVDETVLSDDHLELSLPDNAKLSDIDPGLLSYGALPSLWNKEEVTLEEMIKYFKGGHTVTVPREGYDDTAVIPGCDPEAVEEAVATAVERGNIWLTNGPASVFHEKVPTGILTRQATLNQPPNAIPVTELTSDSIPEAWKDGKTTVFAIATALSAKSGKTLPWRTVREAVDSGIQGRWIEVAQGSASWPCDQAEALKVVIQIPGDVPYKPSWSERQVQEAANLSATARLEPDGIQELADRLGDIYSAAVGHHITVNVQIDLSTENQPEDSTVEEINSLLSQVSENFILK